MPFQGCEHFCRVDSSSNYFSSQSLNSVMNFCTDRASFCPVKEVTFTNWSSCLLSHGCSHSFFSMFTFFCCSPSLPLFPLSNCIAVFFSFQHTYETGNSLWLESSGRDGFFLFLLSLSKSMVWTERLEVDQLFILAVIFNCAVQQYHNMPFAYTEQYCNDARIQAPY